MGKQADELSKMRSIAYAILWELRLIATPKQIDDMLTLIASTSIGADEEAASQLKEFSDSLRIQSKQLLEQLKASEQRMEMAMAHLEEDLPELNLHRIRNLK